MKKRKNRSIVIHIDPSHFKVLPAGYGKIRITHYRDGDHGRYYHIVIPRTSDVEKLMNKELTISDCRYILKLIRKVQNERLNQRSSRRRT